MLLERVGPPNLDSVLHSILDNLDHKDMYTKYFETILVCTLITLAKISYMHEHLFPSFLY
jgi:hypothetical protein